MRRAVSARSVALRVAAFRAAWGVICDFMERSGKSQRQISRETGLSTSVISQFLNGCYAGDNEEVAKSVPSCLGCYMLYDIRLSRFAEHLLHELISGNNGISIKNNNYYNDALLYHQGERVIVVYDPDNIDKIAVFDMENRAICMGPVPQSLYWISAYTRA